MNYFNKILSAGLLTTTLLAPIQVNFSSLAIETSLVNSSVNIKDIEYLIVNGKIALAISILDEKLGKSRKSQNIREQIVILHQLQVANYCRGAMGRSLSNGFQVIQLIENLRKANGNIDSQLQNYEVDAMILQHKTTIETGSSQLLNNWIDSLCSIEDQTRDRKLLAKIYSGLVYLYRNIDEKKGYKKADIYYSRLKNMSVDNILMEPVERFSFLLTYADIIKSYYSGVENFKSGITILDGISARYSRDLPAISPYIQIQISAIYNSVKNFKSSIDALSNNYQQIEKISQYFKLLTLELLGDNSASLGEYLKSGGYYSSILTDIEKTQKALASSDFVNFYLLQKITVKEIRVRLKRTGKLANSDILELISASADLPYPYDLVTAHKWLDNLTTENLLLQQLFLDRGLIWDAFAVSELTRTQIMRFYSRSSSERYSVRLEPFYNLPTTQDSRTPEGFKIAGKDAIFPVASQQLASIISSQSQGKTESDRTTIVEYSYNFKEKNPSEIHVYIFRPESNRLKVKPISLCINLSFNENSRCKNSGTPIRNSLEAQYLRTATKNIQESSFSNYIKNGRSSILNCRNSVSGKNDTCNRADIFLKEIYQLLIQPISGILPSNPDEKVVFVPQGDLFSIPFSAFKDTSGKYLIEKATIASVPSIFVLGKADQIYASQSMVKTKNSLILGNPSISPDLSRRLDNLPFAVIEASQIAKMYKTNALIGSLATKEKVLESLESVSGLKVLHLATHSLIDNENSFDSTIVVTPTATNPEGTLKLRDFPYQTNVELVVLSTCNSGLGKISTDGIASFSTMLINSGNPTQVVSLWAINDNSSAEIMIDFHRGLLQGKSKPSALRQAMITAMKTKKYADPYYWAAFTLIGNTR